MKNLTLFFCILIPSIIYSQTTVPRLAEVMTKARQVDANGSIEDISSVASLDINGRQWIDENGVSSGSWTAGYRILCENISSITTLNWNTRTLEYGNWTSTVSHTTPISKINGVQSNIGASSSGVVVFSQPEQGLSYKIVMITFKNATGNVSYTFPTAFSVIPSIVSTNNVNYSVVTSMTVGSITVNSFSATGSLMLIGY